MSATDASLKKLLIASEIIEELIVVLLNTRIYHKDNPKIKASLNKIYDKLKDFFKYSEAFRISAKARLIYLEDTALEGATLLSARMIDYLKYIGMPGFEINSSVNLGDLEFFVEILASMKTENPNELLRKNGVKGIKFLSWEEIFGREKIKEDFKTEKTSTQIYQETITFLQDITVSACRGEPINLDEAKEKSMWLISTLTKDPLGIFKNANYTVFDPLSLSHSCRVAIYVLNCLLNVVKNRDLLERIGAAALLHDIGKAWVPSEIIQKRSELTPSERKEMEKHPLYGIEIITSSGIDDPIVCTGVFGHHRDYRGKGGYPDIKGVPISMAARIIRISDIFEGLTSPRPYKKSFSCIQAWEKMFRMKGIIDPALLKVFFKYTGLFPIGTKVILSNGAKGIIKWQTDNPDRPVVEITDGYTKIEELDLNSPENKNLKIKALVRQSE